MKLKHWDVSVLGNKPAQQKENMDFYTSDTDAHLRVKLTDVDLQPTTATFTIVNRRDGSLVSEVVDMEGDTATYHMREEVIAHAGDWQLQVVFHTGKGYTTRVLNLHVGGYLLDNSAPRLEIIENWTTFTQSARDFLRDLEGDHDVWLERIENLEEEYAPKLTEVTAQLAQTANQIDTISLTTVNQSELDLVASEMANIIAHNGDGTKDTEIINARLGVDGKASTSLKARLDETDYKAMLYSDVIEGTKKEVVFDTNGRIQKIQHFYPDSTLARVDSFKYFENKIEERRLLFNALKATIVYDLTTFETTVLSQGEYEDLFDYDLDTFSPWNNAVAVDQKLIFGTGDLGVGNSSYRYRRDYPFEGQYGFLINVVKYEGTDVGALRVYRNFTGEDVNFSGQGKTGMHKLIMTPSPTFNKRDFNVQLNMVQDYAEVKDIRLYELPENSQILYDFETLSADELNLKYPKGGN